jgi:hypothetical protein
MSLLKRMRKYQIVTLNTLMVNFFDAIQKKRIALSQWARANILKRRQRAYNTNSAIGRFTRGGCRFETLSLKTSYWQTMTRRFMSSFCDLVMCCSSQTSSDSLNSSDGNIAVDTRAFQSVPSVGSNYCEGNMLRCGIRYSSGHLLSGCDGVYIVLCCFHLFGWIEFSRVMFYSHVEDISDKRLGCRM